MTSETGKKEKKSEEATKPILSPHRRAAAWDENGSKYRSCCNRIHIKTLARVLAIFDTVITFIHIAYTLQVIVKDSDKYGAVGVGWLIAHMLIIIVLVPFFYGLHKEKAAFLLPYIFISGVWLVAAAMASVGMVVVYANRSLQSHWELNILDEKTDGPDWDMDPLLLIAFTLALVLTLYAWVFHIIVLAYRFLKDKHRTGQPAIPLFLPHQLSHDHFHPHHYYTAGMGKETMVMEETTGVVFRPLPYDNSHPYSAME